VAAGVGGVSGGGSVGHGGNYGAASSVGMAMVGSGCGVGREGGANAGDIRSRVKRRRVSALGMATSEPSFGTDRMQVRVRGRDGQWTAVSLKRSPAGVREGGRRGGDGAGSLTRMQASQTNDGTERESARESARKIWREAREDRKRRRKFSFEKTIADLENEDPLRLFWQKEFRELEASELSANYSKIVPMTVNILRSEYGESPRRWWGDLSASETRTLYHSLLPTIMLLENEDELKDLPLKNRAYIASMARYAARLYARERCRLPGRWAASLYDAIRHAIRYGRWSWTGMTVDEIWLKYEMELRNERGLPDPREKEAWREAQDVEGEADEGAMADERRREKASQLQEKRMYKALYKRILSKSCSTNRFIDRSMNVPTPVVPNLEEMDGE